MRPLEISVTITDPRTKEILIVSGSLDILRDLIGGVKIILPKTNEPSESQIVDMFIKESGAILNSIDRTCRTSVQELHDRYSEWCKRNGYHAMSSVRLAREWERLGLEAVRNNQTRYWMGIKF